jgi:hypothetical protein
MYHLIPIRHRRPLTNIAQGIAFCEYVDPAATEVAVTGLNGMDLGEKRLVVRKASIGVTQVAGEMSVNAMSMLAGTTSTDPDMSRVLQLLNMVTPEELMDNDDYEGKQIHPLCPILSPLRQHMLTAFPGRNQGGCPGGVLQVRHHCRAEDTAAVGTEQVVGRRGQDLRQVRDP